MQYKGSIDKWKRNQGITRYTSLHNFLKPEKESDKKTMLHVTLSFALNILFGWTADLLDLDMDEGSSKLSHYLNGCSQILLGKKGCPLRCVRSYFAVAEEEPPG